MSRTLVAFDPESGRLTALDMTFADGPYAWSVAGKGRERFCGFGIADAAIAASASGTVVSGRLVGTQLTVRQELCEAAEALEERITIKNEGDLPVVIDRIECGLLCTLSGRLEWRLVAIPFRTGLSDGSIHDYDGNVLAGGFVANVSPDFPGGEFPRPINESILRSEAWAWGTGDRGLVVMKYNADDIELSVAEVERSPGGARLRFGGAGLSLHGEPAAACRLEPGQTFAFGTTFYQAYTGGLEQAFYAYRDLQRRHGHGFPPTYDPPVAWNVLYDVGWYHSDKASLEKHYSRKALLREAEKARDCHCELLYLDPGWEIGEGQTLWDEQRLGPVRDLSRELRECFGLGLGFRTVLRDWTRQWPATYRVQHGPLSLDSSPAHDERFAELCLCNPVFWQQKLERILAISRNGVGFMMFDEMDWRGPCFHSGHGHPVPSTLLDHVFAVYRLCEATRQAVPGLTVECHDPVWPWHVARYVPTYFKQGFGERGMYDENWGFEFMWNCLEDLRSGRAKALYYYALACEIPLYLHITMAADNDACIFFWWAASTVRHLGVGGKFSSPTVQPPLGLDPFDPERRFAAYQQQMALYRQLKPYLTRGTFHGLSEDTHLHTMAGMPGGVLNLFNLTDESITSDVLIPTELLHGRDLPVTGGNATWEAAGLRVRQELPPMSPVVVCIGEAAVATR